MFTFPDISHWKPVSDWTKAKKNCNGLISKATQGTDFIDSTLDSFISGCEANGIPYWLYVYLDKGNELAQTKYMISVCKDKVGKYFVGYALDVEAGNTASGVKSALDYLESVSDKCMLYTMHSQYSTYKSVITGRGANTAWWEARYGANNGSDTSASYPCHDEVDLHQYTSVGQIDGLHADVDLNKINSDRFSQEWYLGGTSVVAEKESDSVSVVIGSARWGESGGYSQKAGDASGNEVSTQAYYVHEYGWYFLRAKDANKRKKIGDAMLAACANQNIGYDMGDRLTLYTWLKNYGSWNPAEVTSPVETDCSALVRVCCLYAGISVGNFTTANEKSTLLATGQFEEVSTPNEYGTIMVSKKQGHTAVTVSGSVGSSTTATTTTTSTASGTLSKAWQWKGKVVNCSQLNVRKGAGTSYANLTKYPRLNVGDTVQVCDSTKASDGATWYYVYIETGKCYGFVHSSYIKKV